MENRTFDESMKRLSLEDFMIMSSMKYSGGICSFDADDLKEGGPCITRLENEGIIQKISDETYRLTIRGTTCMDELLNHYETLKKLF